MMRRLRIGIRLAAMAAWLLVCIPAHLVIYGILRRRIVPPVFLGGIALIAGVRIDTAGKLARPRAILLANHVSWLDIPVLAATTGAAFVAHDGLADSKFLKWLCEMNDTVFIARTRRATVAHQVSQVREALDTMHMLVLFPEGTTGDGSALLPLKSSLLSAIEPTPEHVNVQPVLVDYGTAAREIAWVGDEPGLENFFRLLGRPRALPVTVRFLEPLAGTDLAGRKHIARAAQHALTRAIAG
ncbi:1-acyl-sn-glycerol-3-phosphate acyltransferase [Croceicoccus ponticola]|uniref:1-acyl-sn-glycerol-3-phosphate acyltransferase n=1 Tax=Croceicoccus ponticola TaxID=2217664 RepID=A0A437H1X8_9SPHN|nr:lysophospholipid acyltransferase family protein [Croceicoccus ponticola]RVQ69522.1 1-acyl-sn-glycerol-3-phosphate acyltransferase [Croceicoccus ponticola]